MAKLDGTKTHTNLKEAFAGESQANRRYLYFAKVADVEGYPDVAGLFKDTADGETGHAHGHLDFLKQVGDPATGEPIGNTEKNLKSAVAGETYEYQTMYPGFDKTAREEGFSEIAEWFETLAKAEKSTDGRFDRADKELGWSVEIERVADLNNPRFGDSLDVYLSMAKVPARAPARPPVWDPHDSRYWDARDLEAELRRTFQVCHECRMCVTYCGSFPRLFESIDRDVDRGLSEGAEHVDARTMREVSDHCWQCKLCFI